MPSSVRSNVRAKCVRTGSGTIAMSASTLLSDGIHQISARGSLEAVASGAQADDPQPEKNACDAFQGPCSRWVFALLALVDTIVAAVFDTERAGTPGAGNSTRE